MAWEWRPQCNKPKKKKKRKKKKKEKERQRHSAQMKKQNRNTQAQISAEEIGKLPENRIQNNDNKDDPNLEIKQRKCKNPLTNI